MVQIYVYNFNLSNINFLFKYMYTPKKNKLKKIDALQKVCSRRLSTPPMLPRTRVGPKIFIALGK